MRLGRRTLCDSGLAHCRRRRKRVVLPEDRGLEVTQSLTGLEAELVAQPTPDRAIDVERLGLPPGAVEGEHEQRGHPLLIRMLGDERLELADELRVTP